MQRSPGTEDNVKADVAACLDEPRPKGWGKAQRMRVRI